MFKFNFNELSLLEITLDQDEVKDKIKRISQMVMDWRQKNNQERREEIALQSRWDGSRYGGDAEGLWMFPEGFSESVFTNLIYSLCANTDDRYGYYLNALILRRAMQQHEHVKLFVKMVISAAEKVCKYEREDKIQLSIRHILTYEEEVFHPLM